ncbi:L-xylulose reductase [Biomphalaria pfeifferi]|uniref:L-xylulose reductase n=1 Tax=Biomphalaria pfeifferi TaxID=112525 RepID=A0AAD8BCH7_BIOPF|nr:L-xylulose reductase [Biomphalaria pfeifferi]
MFCIDVRSSWKTLRDQTISKIRTNAVNPTATMTDMGKYAWSDPEKSKPLLDRIPLGRFAEVHDVVEAVLWLLSDRASYINGVTLPVEGGLLVA